MSIYDKLNPQQLEAVKHDKGPLLILAGAGSGKTRVLTHRIAYLIEERDVNPWNILALTFTNKAAREMRERVDNIVGYGSENIWVSTFHSTCVRILRRYIDLLGYDKNFTIYDTDDQKTLMRDICKYLNIDTKQIKEKTLMSAISAAKDELITPERYERESQGDHVKSKYAKVYKEYQKRLKQNNALDFDDLIFKTVELFETQPEALEYYQKRFKYIMVDEYQDTNTVQFKLISILASTCNEDGVIEHNLCVVGDDDQSIYKFRGANIYNILNFEKQFTNTKVIKLEQNYRSTSNILDAANDVIHNNLGRKDKRLWTDNEEGELISFTQCDTEYEEADTIVSDMYNLILNDGHDYNEFAILYRTNAQSRIFEEKLILRNIPYKIIGGINFYQRKEVKDILAYLKTIDNGLDDIAVKRIINIPRRGIGLTTIDRVSDYAIANGISFYQALKHADTIPGIGRGVSKISPFVSLIEVLKSKLSNPSYSLEDLVNEVLEATGYLRELELEDTEESQARIENINELINKIVTYEQSTPEEPSLSGFLEEVALVADIDNLEESTNVVVLMTLHSAKGLEFPYVYLCGMEEGIFPGYMSINSDDPTDIEEERRLCYVGITRAMKRLYLSAARQRMVRGETQFNRPSRFINEIPRYLLNQSSATSSRYASSSSYGGTAAKNAYYGSGSNQKGGIYTPQNNSDEYSFGSNSASSNKHDIFANNPYIKKGFGGSSSLTNTTFDKVKTAPAVIDYGVGDTVSHTKFGVGIVTDMVKQGDDYLVCVDFVKSGTKRMKASFAKLLKL